MKKNFLVCMMIGLSGLFFGGCETAPVTPAPVKKAAPAAVEKERLYDNISVSEAKGVSSPFKTERGTVFPENKMGYKLILTSDVSMPNLLATQLESKEILVQMRIYNRADSDQVLNIVCARGEDRSTYQARGVVFPANRARDIKFTVSEQDSQSLTVIVTQAR